MQDIRDANALVTGASRGIGKGIALALARAGVNVAINYATRSAEAESVASEIRSLGRRAIPLRADVSRHAEVEHLIRETVSALGSINILINNAGVLGSLPESGVLHEEWDKVIDTNLKSAFLVTEAALPQMIAGGWGRIIFLSSIAAQVGGAAGPHYAASKGGLIGLTHSYARRLLMSGITVNAISPAYVETDMLVNDLKASPDRVPIGRFGTLEEAGELAVLLARNGFMTGQTLNLNGGAYMA